jgi:hypothetical protein
VTRIFTNKTISGFILAAILIFIPRVQVFAQSETDTVWIYAQSEPLFNGADTVWVYAEINGKFSRQAPWDVNLVNSFVSGYQNKPEDLDIAEETLGFLNRNVQSVLKETLSALHFQNVSWKKKDYNNWRGLAEPIFTYGGDRYFRIDVVIAGDNGLGGHYGGTDIQLYFKSLHRSTNVVYGYSFRTLRIGSSEEETLLNLKNVFTEMLKESHLDWKASLDKDLKSPRRYLILYFDTEELNPKQKKFIRTSLFPCLYSRADSLGYVDMKNFYYQVFYRLANYSEGGTEEEYLNRYAELLLFSMGSSAKYPCSLWKTPMENYRATVKIDSVDKLITIGWKKPE